MSIASAIRSLIIRLNESPPVMWEKEPNDSEGWNAAEINRLAGRTILEAQSGNDGSRWLTVHAPDGSKAEWRLWWSSDLKDWADVLRDRQNPKKVERIIGYLNAWLELLSAAPQPAKNAAATLANAEPATPISPPATTASTMPAAEQMNPVALALAFVIDRKKATGKRPKWDELVKAVPGTSKATLSRDPTFKAAWNAAKNPQGQIPKGEKTDAGIEAACQDDPIEDRLTD
jgi:hypothetical protein